MTGASERAVPEVRWRPITSGSHPQCIDCAYHLFTDFTLVNSILWDMGVLDYGVDVNALSVGVCTVTGRVVRCYAPACDRFRPMSVPDSGDSEPDRT